MEKEEYTYWMALAHMERLYTRRKNELIVTCYQKQLPLSRFFMSEEGAWMDEYGIAEEELELFRDAKSKLANYSFVVEDLLNQGYQLIPITEERYPGSLKRNLKYNAPVLLYVKGNVALLNEPCVAIVGSRNAQPRSLEFTSRIAQLATSQQKVVVSGYAKGVDKQAFDAAVNAGGRSVIILPQGITTFGSNYQLLHKQISSGKVAVVSAFAPTAPWSVALAMARNPIIYAFAEEIYVAESDAKGGTFSGVEDGLRKHREIYVRYPDPSEKCANLMLIQLGAKPVDEEGHPKVLAYEDDYEAQIRNLITNHPKSARDIAKAIYAAEDLSTQGKVKRLLSQMADVVRVEGSPLKFLIEGHKLQQLSLF
jgi:predicted Rossmann fold nucleotide-binding protein DprA/Smf involved in DNA uptake